MARNISPLVGPPRGAVYGFKIPELQEKKDTLIVITDASHIGWGGIVCYQKNSIIQVKAGRWPKLNGEPDTLYESSVIAEPQAIRKTLETIQHTHRHVTIVTDHSPIVSASRSHQARSYQYFALLEWLEGQPCSYNILFIPGEINPADKSSRNPDNLEIEEEEVWSICRAAGMGYARALQFPCEVLPSVCASTDADVLTPLS